MATAQTIPSQPKKAYHAPELRTMGTIQQLTQGGASAGTETLGNSASG